MKTPVQDLRGKSRAETALVEDLVLIARRGHVRVPTFQRGLRWEAKNVIDLFDSVYRGYPIGSLLLRRGHAPAGVIKVGPLVVDAPETDSALWVVDGQQRLTALTVGLTRPLPIPASPEDPFVVYFDAKARQFCSPPRTGDIPTSWVPAPHLLDAAALSEWVFTWVHKDDKQLRSALFEAGRRIREYKVPQYIVDSDDEQMLRKIFYRVNNSGKSLKWDEVHDALFGDRGPSPSTLSQLGDLLTKLGMGRPHETRHLLPSLLAVRGLDVTRSLPEHYRRDPEVLRDAVRDSLAPLRRVLDFFRRHAGIPHLRLLPRATQLVILARFFRCHPEPKPRTYRLLARWVWRGLLGETLLEERTFRRRCISSVVDGDEEQSAQNLVNWVSSAPPKSFQLPRKFDARTAESRICLLGMTYLRPLELGTGRQVDVALLIENRDVQAFRRIVASGESKSNPENCILDSGKGLARTDLKMHVQQVGMESPTLASHGISKLAASYLVNDDTESFVTERRETLESVVAEFGIHYAEWSQTDRPTIDYLLEKGREEDQ